MIGFEQVWAPLLRLRGSASAVADVALITYYTSDNFHLRRLEREIVALESDLEALRIGLQAVRSRGEDPMKDALA